ncbi:ORF6N domain-containing protein [Neoroseomonas rubea]|uniref:ORF6N domain-containing protein n=1 Tax=Neoroseomonas rubea TaxID=2748666 RepID=UPI0018DF446B|nr:ORF6N domain-containing protein [Roseomonas rubea]
MTGKTSDAAIITIGAVALRPIEHASQRMVTLDMIDQVHGRPKGTARKRFNDNRTRFIEGEDFIVRNADEAAALGIRAPNGLTLLSESGYLLLAKSLTDDVAWDVQRKLVAHYFRARATEAAAPLAAREHGGITKAVVNRALADHLMPVHAALSELTERLTALSEGHVTDPAVMPAREFLSALSFLESIGWPQRGRRAMVCAVSARLSRHAAAHGYPVKLSAERAVRLFHRDCIVHWQENGGRAFLAACRDRREGQGRLRLDRSRRMGRA